MPFLPGQSGNPAGRPKRLPTGDHVFDVARVPPGLVAEIRQRAQAELMQDLMARTPWMTKHGLAYPSLHYMAGYHLPRLLAENKDDRSFTHALVDSAWHHILANYQRLQRNGGSNPLPGSAKFPLCMWVPVFPGVRSLVEAQEDHSSSNNIFGSVPPNGTLDQHELSEFWQQVLAPEFWDKGWLDDADPELASMDAAGLDELWPHPNFGPEFAAIWEQEDALEISRPHEGADD